MKSNFLLLLILNVLLLSFCRPKKTAEPQKPNENELITTLIFELQNENDANERKRVFSFRDLDGDGPLTPTLVIDSLTASTTYIGKVILLDESKAVVDTISNEVAEEKEEHQFFFRTFPSDKASFTYQASDVDDNGVPFGMFPKLTTNTSGTFAFEIELRHQPNNLKPKSGNGDATKGDVDIKVIFNDVKVLPLP
ncbi:MAG: hypothetical protein SNJ77_01835 [Cytophagales bacterium]